VRRITNLAIISIHSFQIQKKDDSHHLIQVINVMQSLVQKNAAYRLFCLHLHDCVGLGIILLHTGINSAVF